MAFGPDRNTMTRTQARSAEIDVGLRSYMLRVYNYMSLGVAFTGLVSLGVAMNPEVMMTLVGGPMIWVFFIGILGMGFVAPRIMMSKSVGAAQAVFWIYAAMWGIVIAPYFHFYTGESVARVFFITAASFAGLSLYGYTTKRNLAPMGAFLCMSTFGIIIAVVVNALIFQSPIFHTLLAMVVVLVFAGITAYETQAIKNMYYEADGNDVTTRKAIFGAFMLYGSFVTIFVWLLSIMGVMRE